MRIGTRGSALALAQAGLIGELLAAAGHSGCEIVPMTTSGDRLSAAGGNPATDGSDKSRWVTELEDALGDGRIDLAVHSAKDVPGELADGLALHGAPARAAAEDVLCGAAGLDELPAGARVGTSSIRRLAQLRAAREDLDVVAIRGNVDTRLRKLTDAGEGLDAIVLAYAGLQRLGRSSEAGGVLDAERFVPAPGQGVLALEGREGDDATRAAVAAITDKDTFACLIAERAVAQALDASCHTPLGAYAVPAGCGGLNLRTWVGVPDGSAWVGDELAETGTDWGDARSARIPESASAEGAFLPASASGFYDPQALGQRVAERMLAAGAGDLLRRAEEMAAAR